MLEVANEKASEVRDDVDSAGTAVFVATKKVDTMEAQINCASPMLEIAIERADNVEAKVASASSMLEVTSGNFKVASKKEKVEELGADAADIAGNHQPYCCD